MALPASTPYLVVGAGIHGLSTAYHLAKELEARGLGAGADIVVLDKHSPGAGASGIACGVVRNNYFQPAMSELMQACVEVWESDPAAYAYNPRRLHGARRRACRIADLTETYERQEKIGYRSTLDPRRARGRRLHEGAASRTGGRRASPCSCTSSRAASRSTSTPSWASSAKCEPNWVRDPLRRRGEGVRVSPATARSRP